MAIRLRTVDGIRVALCAARSMPKPDDVYLDDADHYALTIKFGQDMDTTQPFADTREAALMEREESGNPNRAWWDARFGGQGGERGSWRQARGAVPPRTEGSPEAAIRALRDKEER